MSVSLSSSLLFTGSLTLFSGGISATQGATGSLYGTSSFAVSASWAPSEPSPTIKSGVIPSSSFTGNPLKATVTFTSSFSDNDYSINVTGEDPRYWSIESKTSGSFVINSNTGSTLLGSTYWDAVAY